MTTNDQPTCQITAQDHRIPFGDGHIFARDWAGGDTKVPIVLLHDSLGAVTLWRDFPERLAEATGRRVIAYDRPGFGQSSPRTDVLSPGFVAEEAHDVIPALGHALGLTRFIVCGHSVGGGMAVETAAAHPDRVAALITIAAQAFIEDRTREGIRAAKAAFADPAELDRLARHHGTKARWVLDAWTETWLSPGFADWSLDRALSGVRCPALVMHGARDEYGSDAQPRQIAATTGGQLVILPGTGHVPHREATDLTIATIRDFLQSAQV